MDSVDNELCDLSVYRVKVNGNIGTSFIPERGLRQGDPLSPYLFLLCAGGFSALLNQAQNTSRIKGMRICQRAPSISHLLFADDSLLLVRANGGTAVQIQAILNMYEQVSGQTINKGKSAVLFSPNTSDEDRFAVKETLQISNEAMNDRYLGLPVHVGASRSGTFSYLKDRIWQQIMGWKEKMLSKAGKEIMIKAVAQAIPTFAMGCFDLTKGLCDKISSMVAKFWWSQQDKDNKMHWLSWDKLTQAKEDGGLGFRDIYGFNMAMLAKQAWRLLTCPDSLCARVLAAKYFPECGVLKAKHKSNMSYTWRSILSGVELLKKGIIWRVGDGVNIRIWEDEWIPRDQSRRPFTSRGQNLMTHVNELINPINGAWDEELVREMLWEEDVECILSIPVHAGMDDLVAWHFNTSGEFSVRSAYKVFMEHNRRRVESRRGGSTSATSRVEDPFWKHLWNLNCPKKMTHLLWRMGHNSLALRINLRRRGMRIDT